METVEQKKERLNNALRTINEMIALSKKNKTIDLKDLLLEKRFCIKQLKALKT